MYRRVITHSPLSRSILWGSCKPLMTGGTNLTTTSTKLRQNWKSFSTVRNNGSTIAPPFLLISKVGGQRRSHTGRYTAAGSKVAPIEELSTKGEVGAIEATAQGYYDNPNAINVHKEVWGGITIHIGRYDLLKGKDANLEGKARIKRASELTTDMLLRKAFPNDGPSPSGYTIMDMGSSYGHLARKVAKSYGCRVVCIELSATATIENVKLTAAAGLSEKIIIPGERSFFDTQMPASSIDIVVSQDTFLHASTEHDKAIKEAARVLKPGGIFVFSDLMSSDTVDKAKLAEMYKNLEIVGLASPASYKRWGDEFGLEFVEYDEYSSNFATHYASLVEVIKDMHGSIAGVESRYLDWMTVRYSACAKAAKQGLLSCGLMVFKKKVEQE